MENAPLEERLLLTAQLSKIQLAADDPSDVTTTDISVISPAPVDYMSQLKSKALAVLTTDTLPQSFYTRTAQALLSGRMTQAEANLRLVRTQTARDVITQGLYQALFNTSPTAMQIKPYISGPLQNAGMRQRLFHMAAGDAYYQYSGSNAETFRLAVAGVFLGQPSLPPSYAKMPVATVNQRRALLNKLTKTSEFRSTWTAQLAKVANNSGTFTADQLRQASAGFQAVLGFERTLARLLTYPVSQADVVNRVQNVPVNAGQPLNNVWQTNRQWLVPERTISTAPNAGMQSAANGSSTKTTSLSDANLVIPAGSNWGDRVAFPGVSYNAIMAATQSNPAAVPVLSLPTGVISGANLSSGVSIAMWVQAQGPGMLLSADYSVGTGSNLTVPYLWINQSGQVEGGLYGPGNISATANQTILSSAGVLGNTEIGSPLAISSQTGIIDNTWHQVAFVANQTSQALYVDGLLQGTSTSAAYLQNASGLTTSSSSNNITLSLNQQTANGSAFTTQVFQNGACSYLLSGTANSSGTANLTVKPGTNPPSIFTVVSSATLTTQNNTTTLTLTMENSVGSTDAVGLAASYQTTSGTQFSLTPSFANGSGYTLGQLQAVNTGGSIYSLATDNLAPNTNYPQPFIGAVDELGLWGTTITQAEVQAVMTVPSNLTEKVTLPSGKSISNVTEPTYYFNFNGNATQTTFTSQSPATNNTATANAIGLITGVAATIPTAPFGNITRLPGYQDFGIGLMTPLATGSLDLGSTSTTVQFSLAVSDQLALSIPAASQGNLTVLLYDDQNAQVTTSLAAGKEYYIVANRTGSYKMELDWSPNVSGANVNLNYYMVPGALNSLPELFTSYQPDVSSPSDIVYAYADPTLPTINKTSNNDVSYPNATGPANYFPLWNDSNYFPTSANYTSADLSQAYSLLVANLTIQNTGLNDFCNINLGGTVDNPATIQNYLATAYQDATGASSVPAPPTTTSGLYPVAPAGSAFDAVYEFLYNTNVLRENIYTAIVGGGSDNNNLSSWLQSVYDLANSSDIPSDIANEIFSGQAKQVTGESLPIQTNAGKKSSTPIWETALTYGIGEGLTYAALASFGPVAAGLSYGSMYMCLGLESLANSSVKPSVSTAYISFTPVINAILNYASLTDLANSIVSGQAKPFNNYASTVTSTAYLQSIFSNYGLLTAMSAMTGTALGDTNTMDYSTALNSPMTQTSWQSMIPATFTWQPVPSYGFPSGNMGSGSANPAVVSANTTSYKATGVAAIASADFNNDGVPDAVLSNNDSSTVSVMLGIASDPVPSYNQSVSFSSSSGTTLDTDGFTQCSGIAAGDLNNDGFQDILVNSYNLSESALAFGNGTGSFSSFTGINLAGGTSPQDIVVADFNQDGWLDYATAAYGSSTVVVGINTTSGNTSTSYSAIASYSTSISTSFNSSTYTASFTTYNINTEGATGGASLAVGDFNNDNYPDIILSGSGSSTMGLLMNAGFANSTWNGFDKAQNLGLNGLDQIGSLAVGDYNGDGNQDVILQGSYGDITYLKPNYPAVPTSMGGNGNSSGPYAYWFFKGSGTANATTSGFATPQWMGMNDMNAADLTTIPASLMGGGAQDGLAISLQTQVLVVYNPITEMNQYQANPSGYFYGEVISNENVTAVDLKTLPGGCTGYYVPVNTSYVDNTAITIASNGMILVGYDGKNSSVLTSKLGYSQNSLVNTLATYAPGQNASTSLRNLSGSVTATTYLGHLQGGFVTTIPNYFPDAQAYVAGTTNLVVNTQIASPGFFLSWSPATVSGTLNGKNQTTKGGIVTGWNLVDSNGNPIALGTLNSLFGAPAPLSSTSPAILPNLWQGTTPAVVSANNPISAYNGGWYFNSKPVNSAPTTWAGAFFDWGTNVAGFSPGTLVPVNVTGVQIPGASSTYNITYSAATSAPPSASSFTANSISTASVAAAPSKLTRISRK